MFKRKVTEQLKQWKDKYSDKYAVLLQGARRVGKSTIAKNFAEANYKSHILKSGRKYLGRLQEVMNGMNLPYADPVTESTEVFNSADDVDRVFNMVREYYVIESTDNQLMETVMAEAIVEYTILETFNTLRLMNFTKESVRQMARKNISK